MLPKSGLLLPTKTHILALAVIIVAPVLLFVAILLTTVAGAERSRLEASIQENVRALAAAVDREIAGLQYTLFALAQAPVLEHQSLEAFHHYIQKVGEAGDSTVVLRDRNSRQLVNSSIPVGHAMPDGTALREADEEAAKTRDMVVSNLFTGLTVQRPTFAVVMPILRQGEVAYFLSLSTGASRLAELLDRTGLLDYEIGVIIDRNNVVVARSKDHAAFVGTRARANLVNARAREGRVESENIDGEWIETFFARSELTGWTIGISVPKAKLNAPLNRSMWLLGVLGLVLIALSAASAIFLARRFSRPIAELARSATALGRGQPVPPLETSVSEIREAWQNMSKASEELQSRTLERDRADAALRTLNETLEDQILTRTAQLRETNEQLMSEMRQRQESEERLSQVQKIEAVGQLTGGIAHDFNNMLAAILGGLQLIGRRLARGDTDVQPLIERVTESTNRAAQLTKRLLAFSRRQPLSPKPADANKLIQGMSELLQRTLPELVSMETVLAGGLWRIYVDASQLENAILNLAVNARDAMPDGGKLTIETSNAHLDERYAAQNPDVTVGQYVLIAVSDTGTGMPDDVAARAFDPFFTTKPEGHGTGLGLSQVHGFLKQSGGHVKIYSESGQGTTVKLYLPRFLGPDVTTQDAATAAPHSSEATEVILVVEDDKRVRATTVGLLQELGYPVIEATTGSAALRILDAEPGVRLLFTDVVMPEMNGRKLADEARARRPELKILFTTGYTRNAVVHNGVLDAGVHMIAKPFTIEALALKIREVLDG